MVDRGVGRSSLAIALVVAAACLLVAAPAARAHPGPPDPVATGGADRAPIAIAATGPTRSPEILTPAATLDSRGLAGLALLVPLALLALADRRWRRAVPLGLIAILSILVFETGVHSVHHLGDADRRANCAIMAATSELSGLVVSSVQLVGVPIERPRPVVRAPGNPASSRPVSPTLGRAPPAPAA
jgi:hypothetical protein